jgi:putative colanic acid biosynthesis acetyltransferase WcaF
MAHIFQRWLPGRHAGYCPNVMKMPERSLSIFTSHGYNKGRGIATQTAWMLFHSTVFKHWWCPNVVRIQILRLFGASIGDNVLIRHGVRIHWPWKLRVGRDSWIGENAWILNLEPVSIGSNVCISQEVLLCTGSHDYRSPSFEFDNAPITIGDGVWVAARATVLRGVTIGARSVIGATALVTSDIRADQMIVAPKATQILGILEADKVPDISADPRDY